MTREPTSTDQLAVDRGLLVAGLALVGAGALLAAAGGVVCGTAVVLGVRRWVRASGVPATELATRQWQRALEAARSGTDTWRGHAAVPAPRRAPSPTRVG